MNLRCIIADDEPLAVRLLQSYVERHPRLTEAGAFTDPAAALAAIRAGGVDVAFLDISMPGMSGMELARVIADTEVRVVFVTAYREYAVEGFRVQALDYLLKPVSYEEFCEAADRALTLIKPPSYLVVRCDYRQVRVEFDDIIYIQGLKDYVRMVLAGRDRPILTQMSLKSLEDLLPAERFRRVHRSYIVNTDHIDYIRGGVITMQRHTVPVGAAYRCGIAEFL